MRPAGPANDGRRRPCRAIRHNDAGRDAPFGAPEAASGRKPERRVGLRRNLVAPLAREPLISLPARAAAGRAPMGTGGRAVGAGAGGLERRSGGAVPQRRCALDSRVIARDARGDRTQRCGLQSTRAGWGARADAKAQEGRQAVRQEDMQSGRRAHRHRSRDTEKATPIERDTHKTCHHTITCVALPLGSGRSALAFWPSALLGLSDVSCGRLAGICGLRWGSILGCLWRPPGRPCPDAQMIDITCLAKPTIPRPSLPRGFG